MTEIPDIEDNPVPHMIFTKLGLAEFRGYLTAPNGVPYVTVTNGRGMTRYVPEREVAAVEMEIEKAARAAPEFDMWRPQWGLAYAATEWHAKHDRNYSRECEMWKTLRGNAEVLSRMYIDICKSSLPDRTKAGLASAIVQAANRGAVWSPPWSTLLPN